MRKSVLIGLLLYPTFFFHSTILAASVSGFSSARLASTYQKLRQVQLDPNQTAKVENLTFTRDAATFTFSKGQFYFFQPVAGWVTGAVFVGEGLFTLRPPTLLEEKQLTRFTGRPELSERFEQLYLRFTDDTFRQLRDLLAIRPGAITPQAVDVFNDYTRRSRDEFRENIEARILSDMTFPKQGCFLAEIRGQRYENLRFLIDPTLVEEVRLFSYWPGSFDWWNSFHLRGEYGTGRSPQHIAEDKRLVDAANIFLDVKIDEKRKITADADLEFIALVDGPRVLHLNLAHTLRVSKVVDAAGQELRFIQEAQERDADFWFILPKRLSRGAIYKVTVSYSGDQVIHNGGRGTFFVDQSTNWYPNFGNAEDRTRYRLKFQVPKQEVLIATGNLVNRTTDGNLAFSEWETQMPYSAVAFNYGQYQKNTQREGDLEVNVFVNLGLQEDLKNIDAVLKKREAAGGSQAPASLSDSLLSQNPALAAIDSIKIFTQYFGPIPFDTLSITQQPAVFSGQSSPTLIYLPFPAFLDATQRRLLFHLRRVMARRAGELERFFHEVGSHEIAHQWWGHLVGWKTYHDHWLSEGFAQFSAGLYLQRAEGQERFLRFLKSEREKIVKRLPNGQKATEVGPLWLDIRLESRRTPGARSLVYAKGGYVLHMLRMMLYDFHAGSDERFIRMMKDFVGAYYNKSASTADFQKIVERHLGMKMDWFFDEWVYGTEVPTFGFSYTILPAPDRQFKVRGEVKAKNVSESFRMPVPVLLKAGDRLAPERILAKGSSTPFELTVSFKPDTVEFNPMDAVLSEAAE
ncbi:MAG: hypothetical protein HY315_03035 [Acidobacteria bacterium]|nr:hypothetical protein [Acidobacteriota bacterium]